MSRGPFCVSALLARAEGGDADGLRPVEYGYGCGCLKETRSVSARGIMGRRVSARSRGCWCGCGRVVYSVGSATSWCVEVDPAWRQRLASASERFCRGEAESPLSRWRLGGVSGETGIQGAGAGRQAGIGFRAESSQRSRTRWFRRDAQQGWLALNPETAQTGGGDGAKRWPNCAILDGQRDVQHTRGGDVLLALALALVPVLDLVCEEATNAISHSFLSPPRSLCHCYFCLTDVLALLLESYLHPCGAGCVRMRVPVEVPVEVDVQVGVPRASPTTICVGIRIWTMRVGYQAGLAHHMAMWLSRCVSSSRVKAKLPERYFGSDIVRRASRGELVRVVAQMSHHLEFWFLAHLLPTNAYSRSLEVRTSFHARTESARSAMIQHSIIACRGQRPVSREDVPPEVERIA
ncbi:hypothetical protein K438DRAFT_2121423 [Mycena galopus ATCC 62051]|nr:hypothetical protein K438DRAFT_2121423 [Mycena galopus ATCC 62051]